MLNAQLTFGTGNMIALLAWLALLVSLFVAALRERIWTVTGRLIPALFAVGYVVMLAQGWGRSPGGGFGSVAEVRTLFGDDNALTAGWLHYLAFDLFVGTWIARDGLARGVPALLLIPCLALTFLVGPVGLLLYLLLRLPLRQEARS